MPATLSLLLVSSSFAALVLSTSKIIITQPSVRISFTSLLLTKSTIYLPLQYFRSHNTIQPLFTGTGGTRGTTGNGSNTPVAGAPPKTVGRWLKDRKEKKKEESRAHNAHVHAAVSVAAVASAVAAIAAATAASSQGKNEQMARVDMAMASAAALVAAQCVEAAENMGAERDHLASVVSSAVNVKSHDDIVTLTAAAATGIVLLVIKLTSDDMWIHPRFCSSARSSHVEGKST